MPDANPGPVPELRFPEFRDAEPWEVKRLGEVGTISKGKGVSKSDIKPDGTLPCIRYGELYTLYGEVIREVASSTDADPAGLVLSEENDVIIPASGETKEDIATASCVTIKGAALGGDLNIFRSALNGAFLAFYVRGNLKSEISKVAQGDSVVHLYPSQLEKLRLAVPPKPEEQQKIADCLSSLDDLIQAEGARLEGLKDHKRGLMQRLFPAPGETTPRLRFPEFHNAGPWQVKRLGEIAVRVTDRNSTGRNTRVLTNSAELGVVDQRDFFNKDIAVKENLAGYTLVKMDDFVYNPRISASAPVGPISRNKIAGGVMSPLYTIFRVGAGCLDFLEFFFQTNVWHPYMRAVGSSGARHDRLSVSIGDFLSLPVLFPIEGEQKKIADCLIALDDLIRVQGETIEALKTHKRGLMQKLFPQEVG